MAEEITQKRRTRAGHRGAVTRKLADAETLLTAAEPDLAKLTQVKVTLEEKREALRELDQAITDSIEVEADLIEEICQADKTREDIGAMLYRIGTVIGTPPAATTEHSATVQNFRS